MTESEQDKGYEVVDKRKVKLDEDGQVQENESAETESTPEAQSKEVEEMQPEGFGSELPPVDVYSLIKSFIGILGSQVWQWMGLIKNPTTGKLDKDLSQAKVAIDTIRMLVNQIEDKLSQEELRELRAVISDLQINFVQQSSKE